MSEKLTTLRKQFDELKAQRASGAGGLVSTGPGGFVIAGGMFNSLLEVVEEQAKEIDQLKRTIQQMPPPLR